jgi:hypothetical protein
VPELVQETVSVTGWPLSKAAEDDDIVTVVPVKAEFTVTLTLRQAPAAGTPVLLSPTKTA